MIPKLKQVPFDFDGRTYILRCNYNVLADIQERYDGIPNLASNANLKTFLTFLTAMMNDYADEQGWPVLTERQVGRSFEMGDIGRITDLMEPVFYALYTSAKKDEAKEESDPN